MAPPAFDTSKPVKLGLNICWMFTSVLMGLFMMMVFFGPRDDKTDADPLESLGDYRSVFRLDPLAEGTAHRQPPPARHYCS